MNSIIGYYRDFKEIKRLIKQNFNSKFQSIKFFNNYQSFSDYPEYTYSSKDEWLYQFIVNDKILESKVERIG